MMPRTKEITVTTLQDVLIANHGKQSVTHRELGINRGTLQAMINDKRPNVVLIGEDGVYTLLK